MELIVLDLFSGIGGFSLGFEAEGFTTIGFAEIDPYASAVLKKHWPSIQNYGDVRNVPAIECDVITGGPPCQPWSQAGKRRGKSDDRHQWSAMRDVVKRCRSPYVLFENVPGISDVLLDEIIADLENLGYAAQPFGVPACAVGLPQIEGQRIFVVAKANGERCDSRNEIPKKSGVAQCSTKGEQARWSIGSFRGNSGRIWEAPITAFDRVDYGLPGELDRLRCLGNAASPALVRPFARAIKEALVNSSVWETK